MNLFMSLANALSTTVYRSINSLTHNVPQVAAGREIETQNCQTDKI